MASWGNKDNTVLTGNVSTSNTTLVQGFGGTVFAVEVDGGDYIAIAGNKYQVQNVLSNTAMHLTSIAATNSANVKAYLQTGPKYVANIGIEQNVYTIQRIIGLDLDEAKVPSSRAKNLKTQGWNHYFSYVGADGNTRHRAECLVAMSKNFDSANVGDYADDTIVLDQYIKFLTQPTDKVVAANANVTIQTVVTSEPAGASGTYQWKSSPNNIVFANVTNTGVFTGATTNTLNISNVANLNGNYFYLLVTGSGLDSITSNTITITHV